MTVNISNYLLSNPIDYDLIVLGSSLWDSLYTNSNIQLYDNNINSISNYLSSRLTSNKSQLPVILWLQPTTIVNSRLNSDDKLLYMNENVINSYRNVVTNNSNILKVLTDVIDTTTVTNGKQHTSTDGVHYSDEVYLIIAHIISNRYAMEYPNFIQSIKSNYKNMIKFGKARATGLMSYPSYGLLVLFISIIMLITLDGFLGIGYLSLVLFGRSYDWDEAFIPLLNKIGISHSKSNLIDQEYVKHNYINKDEKI